MRFPESDRIHFEKDTLVEVIAQLRFPQILTIGTKPPDEFQERLRNQYPLYRKESPLVPPAELRGMVPQLPIEPPAETITHWFESEDRSRAISLATTFVAVTARRYPGWDGFFEEIERAKSALEEVYSPGYYDRIGLRYRDVINRDKLGVGDHPWSDLLADGMISLLGADLGIEPGKDLITTEALLRLDEPEGAQVKLQHGVMDSSSYLIDADLFLEDRKDGDAALELLKQLNRQERYLFRWAISDTLESALGVRDAA